MIREVAPVSCVKRVRGNDLFEWIYEFDISMLPREEEEEEEEGEKYLNGMLWILGTVSIP